MSKRFSRLFLLVAMTAFAAAVQARVILRQNFDDTAVFQPGPLAAKGALKANVVGGDGGFMRVRLLQNGKPLDGYIRELSACDDVAIPLFDTLPDSEFQVEITMKNSRLYTLNF